MAVAYTWRLRGLDVIPSKTIDDTEYTDVVARVHWILEGVDGSSRRAHLAGDTGLDPDSIDSGTFVEFEDLDAAAIVTWAGVLIEGAAPGTVARMKAEIAARIAEQASPTIVHKLPETTSVADADLDLG